MISKALFSLVLAMAFIPGLFGQSPTGFDPSTFSPLKTIEGTTVAALIGMTDEELEKIAIVRDKWQEAIGDFLKLDEKEQSAQRPQLRTALQDAEANVFVILGDSKGKMLLRCHRIEFFRLTALELLRTENFKKEMDCSEEQTTEIERVYAKWLKLTVQKLETSDPDLSFVAASEGMRAIKATCFELVWPDLYPILTSSQLRKLNCLNNRHRILFLGPEFLLQEDIIAELKIEPAQKNAIASTIASEYAAARNELREQKDFGKIMATTCEFFDRCLLELNASQKEALAEIVGGAVPPSNWIFDSVNGKK